MFVSAFFINSARNLTSSIISNTKLNLKGSINYFYYNTLKTKNFVALLKKEIKVGIIRINNIWGINKDWKYYSGTAVTTSRHVTQAQQSIINPATLVFNIIKSVL